MRIHWSDCAVNNGPALPVGECDCGGLELADDAALVIVGQQDSPLPITERPDEVRIVAVGSAEAERVGYDGDAAGGGWPIRERPNSRSASDRVAKVPRLGQPAR